MNNKVLLQPAYVLHRRLYRETSYLVDLFTVDHGLVTAIARGVRKQRSQTAGLLQPFVPLLVSFAGKTDLMLLTHAEAHGPVVNLVGQCLFAGLYVNELLSCLLQKWDACGEVYHLYTQVLAGLTSGMLEQKILRSFEKSLLQQLGYGLLPTSEQELQRVFSADKHYAYLPHVGFTESHVFGSEPHVFSGKSLLAFAREEWDDATVLKDAKRLIRIALSALLGGRMLYSRQLFV
ncbi:MAG TPA: DNA repair protein RecO [Gammaproteobacteria bacterium]|jgi:DNA repair protein RecO (recombination protein O)|nr:DNA repair protein RecO [Gammaproteobacteria bacterium]